MKIRNDFVSNSSSVSYIITMKKDIVAKKELVEEAINIYDLELIWFQFISFPSTESLVNSRTSS